MRRALFCRARRFSNLLPINRRCVDRIPISPTHRASRLLGQSTNAVHSTHSTPPAPSSTSPDARDLPCDGKIPTVRMREGISIVVPVYNSEESLSPLVEQIEQVL